MKTLDVQDRLEYARAGVAVLRALEISNKTMRYRDFMIAIGLIADGKKWQPWHRQQSRDTLNLMAATERQAGKKTALKPLRFELIINDQGKPGAGFYKSSRIVTK